MVQTAQNRRATNRVRRARVQRTLEQQIAEAEAMRFSFAGGGCWRGAGIPGPRLMCGRPWFVVCRMPRRVVEALLAQVLGIEISLGSTQKCSEEASQAVAAPCQELERQLKKEPILNADGTGWRTNGDKRFQWAFVAAAPI
jgi:hypothetical protein